MAHGRWLIALVLGTTACIGDVPTLPPLLTTTEGNESTNGTSGVGDCEQGTVPSAETCGASSGSTAGMGSTAAEGPESTSSGDSTMGVGPMTGSSSTSEPVGTTAGGVPILVISGAPADYNFGNIPVGDLDVVALSVTNEGDSEATNITGQPLAAPFAFTGKGFPGAAGDCGNTLAAADSCTVEVSFAPTELGIHFDSLAISYDEALTAIRSLVGGGQGLSTNLLLNPGAEDQGTPPPNWVDTGPGNWIAGSIPMEVNPMAGVSVFYADTGPNNQGYILLQDADVSMWTSTIDLGLMSFEFEGWARSLNNEDEYRIRVHYRDATNITLDTFSTGWSTSNSWQFHSDQRMAPPGTRSIRVELGCLKGAGQWCNAYYDALDLRAQYP